MVCRLTMFALISMCAVLLRAQPAGTIEAAPLPVDGASSVSTYRLGPGDAVRVVIAGEDDLGAEQMLDERGEIRLPIVGNVRLAGLTLRQAESELERVFRDERVLRHPQVLVTVTVYRAREVILSGQFAKVGRFAFPPAVESMDIVDLVNAAGGLRDTARASRAQVTRIDAAGNRQVFELDLNLLMDARRRPGSTAGFRVLPGDEIHVPQRFF